MNDMMHHHPSTGLDIATVHHHACAYRSAIPTSPQQHCLRSYLLPGQPMLASTSLDPLLPHADPLHDVRAALLWSCSLCACPRPRWVGRDVLNTLLSTRVCFAPLVSSEVWSCFPIDTLLLLLLLCAERNLFTRERNDGLYYAFTYLLAKVRPHPG